MAQSAPAPASRRSRAGRVAMWTLVAIGAVIVATWAFARWDGDSYRMPSQSMLPTIEVSERLVAKVHAYGDEGPPLGDVVVLHPPVGAEEGPMCGQPIASDTQMCARPTPELSDVKFVKRVVGLPGDRLAMQEGMLIRNGEPADEPFTNECGGGPGCDFAGEIEVPADHYYMLGDNRGSSDDSRFWGPVPRSAILGRVERCSLLVVLCDPVR